MEWTDTAPHVVAGPAVGLQSSPGVDGCICSWFRAHSPEVGILAFGEGWHNNHHAFAAWQHIIINIGGWPAEVCGSGDCGEAAFLTPCVLFLVLSSCSPQKPAKGKREEARTACRLQSAL